MQPKTKQQKAIDSVVDVFYELDSESLDRVLLYAKIKKYCLDHGLDNDHEPTFDELEAMPPSLWAFMLHYMGVKKN